jgi:hypothetical protein
LGSDDLSRPQHWRTLANGYFAETASPYSDDILSTPWSQMDDGTYARFVTEGNATDVGTLMLRLDNQGMTVSELEQMVTQAAAIPEGDGAVQPLAMAPVNDIDWWEEFIIGFRDLGFFAGRQPCGTGGAAGRAIGNRAVQNLCDHLGDIQDVLRPDTDAGIPWLSDIPDLGELLPRRRQQPDRPTGNNRPPTLANDNNRPPTPANDNRRPPEPANDNRQPPAPATDNVPQG